MTRFPLPVVVAAAALALTLGGCAAVEPGATAAPAPASSERAGATASSSAVEPAELPNGVIGRATLVGADGSVAVSVEVSRSGDDLLEIRSLPAPGLDLARTELLLAPRPLADDATCFDEGLRYGLGTPVEGEPARWGVADLGEGDPSFLDEAVLVRGPAEATAETECFADIVARGPIEWTFTPLRTGLVASDAGATGGARGDATVEDGVPVAYTVARDDLIEEVAARLGITAGDLLYLNPDRSPPGGVSTLHPGEVLNLVVERR